MTEPTPTPVTQNPSAAPDAEEISPNSAEKTGFFNRVQRELKPEQLNLEPIHPSEAAEIVILEE